MFEHSRTFLYTELLPSKHTRNTHTHHIAESYAKLFVLYTQKSSTYLKILAYNINL